MAGILERYRVLDIWGLIMSNKVLRVMVVGQKWLAEQLLQYCLDNPNIKVVAVSPPSMTDRLAMLAQAHNLPITLYDKVLTARQVPNEVNVILTAHAHCFVEKQARDKATHGAVGYHPSLLPTYKGKTAIIDALANNEQVVGGSLYQLDDGWDTGKVLLQQQAKVDKHDTAISLWQDKLAPLGLELFKVWLEQVACKING